MKTAQQRRHSGLLSRPRSGGTLRGMYVAILPAFALPAQALPIGLVIAGGSATISPTGGTLGALAISGDISFTGSIAANVVSGAGYGGIYLQSFSPSAPANCDH